MKLVKVCLLFHIYLFVILSSAGAADNCRLVPGWKPDATSIAYTADNLYEYLDGGAEGHLIFGFVRLDHQTCVKGPDSLTIDVSEMNDADGAYGLFASRHDPRQPLQPIAMGGEVRSNWASFAKGKYYVELTATPGKEYRPTLRAFAAALEKRLTGRSTPPEAVAWFPKGYTAVRLIPKSVLGLSALKRGFLAEYSNGQAFIVAETTPQSATAVLATLRQRFDGSTSAEVADEAFQANDKYLGAMCIFRKGHYLAGYAHLHDIKEAVSLARTLASPLP